MNIAHRHITPGSGTNTNMTHVPKKKSPSRKKRNLRRKIKYYQSKLKMIESKPATAVNQPSEVNLIDLHTELPKTTTDLISLQMDESIKSNDLMPRENHHEHDAKTSSQPFQILCDRIHMLQKNLNYSAKLLKKDADHQRFSMQQNLADRANCAQISKWHLKNFPEEWRSIPIKALYSHQKDTEKLSEKCKEHSEKLISICEELSKELNKIPNHKPTTSLAAESITCNVLPTENAKNNRKLEEKINELNASNKQLRETIRLQGIELHNIKSKTNGLQKNATQSDCTSELRAEIAQLKRKIEELNTCKSRLSCQIQKLQETTPSCIRNLPPDVHLWNQHMTEQLRRQLKQVGVGIREVVNSDTSTDWGLALDLTEYERTQGYYEMVYQDLKEQVKMVERDKKMVERNKFDRSIIINSSDWYRYLDHMERKVENLHSEIQDLYYDRKLREDSEIGELVHKAAYFRSIVKEFYKMFSQITQVVENNPCLEQLISK